MLKSATDPRVAAHASCFVGRLLRNTSGRPVLVPPCTPSACVALPFSCWSIVYIVSFPNIPCSRGSEIGLRDRNSRVRGLDESEVWSIRTDRHREKSWTAFSVTVLTCRPYVQSLRQSPRAVAVTKQDRDSLWLARPTSDGHCTHRVSSSYKLFRRNSSPGHSPMPARAVLYPLYGSGPIISSGRTSRSNSSSLSALSSSALCLSVRPFLCAFLATLLAMS